MAYNMTELAASNNIYDIVKFANTASGSVLFNFFIVAVFVIIVISLKKYEFKKGFAVASYVCFAISLLFAVSGLVSMATVIVFSLMVAFSSAALFIQIND